MTIQLLIVIASILLGAIVTAFYNRVIEKPKLYLTMGQSSINYGNERKILTILVRNIPLSYKIFNLHGNTAHNLSATLSTNVDATFTIGDEAILSAKTLKTQGLRWQAREQKLINEYLDKMVLPSGRGAYLLSFEKHNDKVAYHVFECHKSEYIDKKKIFFLTISDDGNLIQTWKIGVKNNVGFEGFSIEIVPETKEQKAFRKKAKKKVKGKLI